MLIKLKIGAKDNWQEIDIKPGTTGEKLLELYGGEEANPIFALKVNNDYEALSYPIYEEGKVELLDITNPATNLIYQASLTFLYTKAVKDVLGKEADTIVENSLNKGLYTEIIKPDGGFVTEEEIVSISSRMRELVDADLPIVCYKVGRSEAVKMLQEDGRPEKLKLLSESLNIKKIRFYILDGYRDFAYGLMVPSTGYLKQFELRPYRKGVVLVFPHPNAPHKLPEIADERSLYNAFAEQKRWDNLLEISYVSDLNDAIEDGSYKELIQLSEALHEKKIAQIADEIVKEGKRIILIAGPSSSGKTTFARRLCIQLRVAGLHPIYMGTDDYFVERTHTPLDENGEPDFENLNAVDIDLFNSNLNGLLNGEEVDIPIFDFIEGKKIFGKRFTKIDENQPIVIEGIHALNEALTPYIAKSEKFKIYISPLTQLNIDEHNRVPTTDERMLRRMVRDSQFRGYDAKSTINTWSKVRKGEDKNIFPYSNEADVLFNSYHVYEIAVLKKYAEPLLKEIESFEPEHAEAKRLLRFLKFFKTIDDHSMIVNNSILREFIGGSIFK